MHKATGPIHNQLQPVPDQPDAFLLKKGNQTIYSLNPRQLDPSPVATDGQSSLVVVFFAVLNWTSNH